MSPQKTLTIGLVGLCFGAVSPLQAQLIHRYSFNDAAGDATDAVLTDSVGGADGVVRGAGAVFTGTGLDLPGGDSGVAAYGDLPNNLISPHSAVTVEGWVTVDATTQPWARVFDFGSTESSNGDGEVTGPGNTNGGGTAGLDYFFLSATINGTDYGQQRVEVRNEDPAGGGIATYDSSAITVEGQQFHYAVTWENTGQGMSQLNYWRDGVHQVVDAPVDSNLADLNDVNVWLGRSTWLNDGNLDGTFDEFRIYDVALNADQVAASMDAGPDNPVDFFADDADGDQIPDAYEDSYAFLDSNNAADAALDEDSDGLTNLQEYQLKTSPDDADTDDDGLSDGEEINNHDTNPIVADSDSDGLSDGEEINVTTTNPNDADSDADGLIDGYEAQYAFLDPNDSGDAALDEDSDGLSNLEENENSTMPDDVDSDGDGLSDGDEVNVYLTLPLAADSDNDGLSDADEVNTTDTLPLNADTDGDGISDGPEVFAGTDPFSADATSPSLIHRYAFDEQAGPADQGAVVPDVIGGANGVIVGAGGVWTGASLSLPGGDGGTADAAYVDLPNGLLSAHDHVTFEAWYTINLVENWNRIWDFGSTVVGEVTGTNTGASEGLDYFIYAPSQGTNLAVQRTSIRNNDPAALGGGIGPVDGDEEAADTAVASVEGQEYHVVGVWTSDGNGGGQLTVYRDGEKVNSRTTTFTPRDVNDVNNWLGRSNWTGDNYLNGELNEFRIYDGAMNDAAALASFTAGADAAPGAGGDPVITDLVYDKENDQITLVFTSRPGRQYAIFYSSDLEDFSGEVTDGLEAAGEVTTFGPFANPEPGAKTLFFRVSE